MPRVEAKTQQQPLGENKSRKLGPISFFSRNKENFDLNFSPNCISVRFRASGSKFSTRDSFSSTRIHPQGEEEEEVRSSGT